MVKKLNAIYKTEKHKEAPNWKWMMPDSIEKNSIEEEFDEGKKLMVFSDSAGIELHLFKQCLLIETDFHYSHLYRYERNQPQYEDFGDFYGFRKNLYAIIQLFGGNKLIYLPFFHDKTENYFSAIYQGKTYNQVNELLEKSENPWRSDFQQMDAMNLSRYHYKEIIFDDFMDIKRYTHFNHEENAKKCHTISSLLNVAQNLLIEEDHSHAFFYVYKAEERLSNATIKNYLDENFLLGFSALNNFYAAYNKAHNSYHYFMFPENRWFPFIRLIEHGLFKLEHQKEWEYLSLWFNNLQFRREFSRFFYRNKDHYLKSANFLKRK